MALANLKKPAKAREIVLVAIGMLTICFFAYKNFFLKQKAEVGILQTQLSELNDKVASLEKLNSVLREKRAQALATDAPEEEVETSGDPRVQLINKFKKQKYAGISDFVQDIASPMFRSSVAIDSIKYDPAQALQGYYATKFSMVARGDYTRVLEFLKKLESVAALLAVDNLNMIAEKGDGANVSISLSGTFYQLEDDNA